jgi:hypothetical protein
MTHDLDPGALAGVSVEAGAPNLRLNRSLVIRAADGQRPIIRLAAPLRFRPVDPGDASVSQLAVRLEGLYLTRGPAFTPGDPLIGRAAVASLEISGSTLDPGGSARPDRTRKPLLPSAELANGYGFAPADLAAFQPTPAVKIDRSITGSLAIDDGYSLWLTDSIVDADTGFAIASLSNPATDWGPSTQISGVTIYGRTRVTRMSGRGGVWTGRLEVLDNQHGCLKFCCFSGDSDRLPQTFACVSGQDAGLYFTSSTFGEPGYAQLTLDAGQKIREQGPGDDQMGTWGFLSEAHKWRNVQIRYREFMPVGVRPLLIPVT